MNSSDITFVIPIFQLQGHHEANLFYVIERIQDEIDSEILVVEQTVISDGQYPSDSFVDKILKYENVKYVPYLTKNKYFSRSMTINYGASKCKTKLVWIHDADCVLKFKKIIEMIREESPFIQPFKTVKDLTQVQTQDLMIGKKVTVDYNKKDGRQIQLFGACSVICDLTEYNKIKYDNSYRGWGLEDYDFYDRVSKRYDITVLDTYGIHLFHPERVMHEGKHYRNPKVNNLVMTDPEAIERLNSMSKKQLLKDTIKIKGYFVSLPEYKNRWETFKVRTHEAREKTGVNIELIDAVDTRKDIHKCKEFGLELDPQGLLQQFYFSHGNGAVGCYLSHYVIWKKIVEEDVDYGIAIEDDANYVDLAKLISSEKIPEICDEYDLVQINTRGVTKFAANNPEDVLTTYTGFDGTEAYLVTKQGAQKLIDLTHDHSCFQDIVHSYSPHLWLDVPNISDDKIKVKTEEHFPILKNWEVDYSMKNSICVAADKFLGYACWPGLPDDRGLRASFKPLINLRPGGAVSDILHDTKGYWQMNNGEFMQFILSKQFKWWEKDRRIIRDFETEITDDSIVVVCVGRDEHILIPKFIEHYEYMGATHFIYIDNQSIDNSVNLFESNCNVDCKIIQTNDSYAKANFGLDWVHEQLLELCKDVWCVAVDIDELILLREHETLDQYRNYMMQNNYNVSQNLLVEMYPRELGVECVDDPFEHSDHYDRFTDKAMYFQDSAGDGSRVIKGGVRQRVFAHFPGPANNESCCLVKKSFFKYDFYDSHSVSVGMHWMLPYDFVDWDYNHWDKHKDQMRIDPDLNIIAHFKFVETDLGQYFQTRVDRGQDWNNSEEYKNYIDNLPTTFYDDNTSTKYTTKDQLYKDTIDLINNNDVSSN